MKPIGVIAIAALLGGVASVRASARHSFSATYLVDQQVRSRAPWCSFCSAIRIPSYT